MTSSRLLLVVVGLSSFGFGLLGCGDPKPMERQDAGCVGSDCSAMDGGSHPDVDAGSDAGSDAGADPGPTFVPVRWNTTEHGPYVYFGDDRLRVENRGERGNARSDASIAPGSGVFYFEAERLTQSIGYWGIGVATETANLSSAGSEFDPAANSTALGLYTQGQFQEPTGTACIGDQTFAGALSSFYGFVIDYRGTNPTIHYVLDDGVGGVEIARSCTPPITDPVFIFYDGVRAEVGYQLAINTGADTQNHPFHFALADVKDALVAAEQLGYPTAGAADALVYGFGATRARPASAAPTIAAPADMEVVAGTIVQLVATASDAEDGDLTESLVWTDLSSQYHAPVTAVGGSFSFEAKLGRHPIRLRVADSVGRVAEQVVMVQATGTLPQFDPVVMAPDAWSGADTVISGDGLSVDTQSYSKNGVRANQPIYGQYWYFEAHRNGIPVNVGVGLIIPDGSLNPYDFHDVPWSLAINTFGGTWRNLISVAGWPRESFDHYGFAVDYRGEHPVVHILFGTSGGGVTMHQTIAMTDVWGPIHPMVYGNPWYDTENGEVDPGDEITMNFGASAFAFDPVTYLTGAGESVDGLEVGWGDANTVP